MDKRQGKDDACILSLEEFNLLKILRNQYMIQPSSHILRSILNVLIPHETELLQLQTSCLHQFDVSGANKEIAQPDQQAAQIQEEVALIQDVFAIFQVELEFSGRKKNGSLKIDDLKGLFEDNSSEPKDEVFSVVATNPRVREPQKEMTENQVLTEEQQAMVNALLTDLEFALAQDQNQQESHNSYAEHFLMAAKALKVAPDTSKAFLFWESCVGEESPLAEYNRTILPQIIKIVSHLKEIPDAKACILQSLNSIVAELKQDLSVLPKEECFRLLLECVVESMEKAFERIDEWKFKEGVHCVLEMIRWALEQEGENIWKEMFSD